MMNINTEDLHPNKLANILMSVIKLLIDGQIVEKLTLQLIQLMDTDDLLSPLMNLLKNLLFMQEFLQKNNLTIYNDKLVLLQNKLKMFLSSQILEVHSTSTEKDFNIYLKNFIKETSIKYTYPSPIVLQESHLNFLNGCLNILEQNSYICQPKIKTIQHMNMNSLKTSLESLPIIQQNFTENVNTKQINILQRTLKIRIYPNKTQKQYLKNCLGIYRLVYNKSVDFISKNRKTNYIYVRNSVLDIINEKYPNNNWFNELYFDCKSLAVKEACCAFKSNYNKTSNTHFQVKFKSKNSKNQNLKIDHRVTKFENNNLYIFKNKLKNAIFIRNKDKKKIKNIFDNFTICDSEIIRDNTRAYYLILNHECSNVNIDKKISMLSIDPGIKTLYNCYSKEGVCMKLGNNIEKIYEDKIKKYDELLSLKSQKKGNTKKNLNLRAKKLYKQIKNIVINNHNHIASFVAQTSEEIITSKLDLKKIANKQKRNVGKDIVRNMNFKNISKLENKLKSVCEKYTTKLHIVDESYTSLTCSNCMHKKEKAELKCKRIYNCTHCNLTMDRDYNAAKNILLKHLNLFEMKIN